MKGMSVLLSRDRYSMLQLWKKTICWSISRRCCSYFFWRSLLKTNWKSVSKRASWTIKARERFEKATAPRCQLEVYRERGEMSRAIRNSASHLDGWLRQRSFQMNPYAKFTSPHGQLKRRAAAVDSKFFFITFPSEGTHGVWPEKFVRVDGKNKFSFEAKFGTKWYSCRIDYQGKSWCKRFIDRLMTTNHYRFRRRMSTSASSIRKAVEDKSPRMVFSWNRRIGKQQQQQQWWERQFHRRSWELRWSASGERKKIEQAPVEKKKEHPSVTERIDVWAKHWTVGPDQSWSE